MSVQSRPARFIACHLLLGGIAFVALFATPHPVVTIGLAAEATEKAESKDWRLPRGDAQSTGSSTHTLPQNLEICWETKLEEAIEATPVVSDGRVFVADVMGRIYALDRETGKELWQKNYDTGFIASPAVNDQSVVIGDFEGNLYSLDPKTGQEQWKKTTEGEINGAVAFYKDLVLATSQDGNLYAFNAKDGTLKWTYQTQDQIRCSPTVAGDRTFLGGCDGLLHIVDLETGKAASDPLPLDGPTGSTPAVVGDQAYLPIMDGVVLAFDFKTPKELWRYEDAERGQEYRNSAAVSADLVIVSSQYKQVDALSRKTGERQWRYTLRRRADASPVIAGEDVWIASTDGRLIRLNLKDGKEKWNYEIRGAFLAAPAIAGDQLIIADDEGVVRCFGPAK